MTVLFRYSEFNSLISADYLAHELSSVVKLAISTTLDSSRACKASKATPTLSRSFELNVIGLDDASPAILVQVTAISAARLIVDGQDALLGHLIIASVLSVLN